MDPHSHRQPATPGESAPRRASGARVFWRSLEQRAGEKDGDAGEFADGALEPPRDGLSRRQFVQLLGASAALSGAAACSPPREKILPYARRPAELTPGVPLYFATSMVLDGYATGLVVTSHEGRPTKVEGNPDHPASLGATSAFEQASVLSLYDPDRARGVRRGEQPAGIPELVEELAAARSSGLRLLMPPQSSPQLLALLERVAERHRGMKLTFHAPGERAQAHAGAALLFGRPFELQYDFTAARTVVALDADFLSSMPFSTRWSRQFADQRRLADPGASMNRLYVAEPAFTPTGMLADERLRVRGSEVFALAAALLRALLARGLRAPGAPLALDPLLARVAERLPGPTQSWIEAVARDLADARGESAVIAGDRQPPEVHALALAANAALGNLDATVTLTKTATLEQAGLPVQPLRELRAELEAGQVDTLLILEGNPAYTAPADLELAKLLPRARSSVHLSLYDDETSHRCRWLVPAAHYLEAWGDARAYDGTVSFVQPLIAPLHDGKTPAELLALLLGDTQATAHSLLLTHWRAQLGPAFADTWEPYLQQGLIAGSAFAVEHAAPKWDELLPALERAAQREPARGIELGLALSPTVYDGRFANNAWLEELPDPVTKLTWDNAALIAPATAERLGIASEDVVEIAANSGRVRVPALLVPGHAEDAVTLHLGYGRKGSESVARGVGADAYALRTTAAPHFARAAIARKGGRHELARTQNHFALHGRAIAFMADLAEYRQEPDFTAEHGRRRLPTLLPEPQVRGVAWAMTIDTGVCLGCNACVVACQAENNVPVVGKEQVRKSREMHWLRIDSYFTGEPGDPQVVNQPMLCQHCEHAPCEYVCPVNATVHSPDGLNEMVYNRCIGTRFCSNNCPYKVRRFNWFDFTDESRTQLQRNPMVTVRDRGVMEKCTFCVQRVRAADIQASVERREIRPGEVVTACQQACPTRAIQFGSLSHRDTPMVAWRRQPRLYGVLHDQNTRPRTQYLARIVNPNPDMA